MAFDYFRTAIQMQNMEELLTRIGRIETAYRQQDNLGVLASLTALINWADTVDLNRHERETIVNVKGRYVSNT